MGGCHTTAGTVSAGVQLSHSRCWVCITLLHSGLSVCILALLGRKLAQPRLDKPLALCCTAGAGVDAQRNFLLTPHGQQLRHLALEAIVLTAFVVLRGRGIRALKRRAGVSRSAGRRAMSSNPCLTAQHTSRFANFMRIANISLFSSSTLLSISSRVSDLRWQSKWQSEVGVWLETGSLLPTTTAGLPKRGPFTVHSTLFSLWMGKQRHCSPESLRLHGLGCQNHQPLRPGAVAAARLRRDERPLRDGCAAGQEGS